MVDCPGEGVALRLPGLLSKLGRDEEAGQLRRVRPEPGRVNCLSTKRRRAFSLSTLRGAEQANTRRAYDQVLRRLIVEFGAETALGDISAERFAAWFGAQWAGRSPSTWNVAFDAVRSAVGYWQRHGWIGADRPRRKPWAALPRSPGASHQLG